MPEKTNNPQEPGKGRYVSKEYAKANPDKVFQTTTTVSQEKFKEAEEMLQNLDSKLMLIGLNPEESAIQDVLEWLINDGEKPEID